MDAHCHLADPRFDQTRADVIARARVAGISFFLQGGVNQRDWERQLSLEQNFPHTLGLVFGLHPWHVAAASTRETDLDAEFPKLQSYATQALAIGEIGLDFSKKIPPDSYDRQIRYFQRQLELARDLGKPVVLHIVGAHPQALTELKQIRPASGGLVHAFTGSHEIAREYLQLGFHLSIGAAVTRHGYETLKRAITRLPDERIVIESDAPDQPSPSVPAGALNEPTSIFETAAAIAELRGTTPEQVLSQSAQSLKKLFQLP